MAFGISRSELKAWKRKVLNGEVAFVTHYWYDPHRPEIRTVTKAGCSDLNRLFEWGEQHGLKKEWIHDRVRYPHFDLIGQQQASILKAEGQWEQIRRFNLEGND
ncbi:hypothetical protein [Pseudalkalibacillus caeni]|uniref:YneQ n=1 Tax=Exobacillus caeni TaxID=2574798 RepID=A0A5R9F1K0_9BACL|nr:hypothetical protein [Pseudalkalibacillus caeni]TLS37447.1 hypothetical protein FCL54_09885 [Pseudalkalibacillus caeni]